MGKNSILLHLENVWKIYQMGEVEVPALRGVTVEINKLSWHVSGHIYFNYILRRNLLCVKN